MLQGGSLGVHADRCSPRAVAEVGEDRTGRRWRRGDPRLLGVSVSRPSRGRDTGAFPTVGWDSAPRRYFFSHLFFWHFSSFLQSLFLMHSTHFFLFLQTSPLLQS